MIDQPDWLDDMDAVVAFALRWAPFGGGTAEDIWMMFGIAAPEYYRRLTIVLTHPRRSGIDEQAWARLVHIYAPAPPTTGADHGLFPSRVAGDVSS